MENKQNIKDLIQKFYPHAKEKLGFDHPVRVIMRQDAENAKDSLGKTAYYDPAEKLIVLYVTNRHPKDVLRSFSHELVHHAQNCRGDLDDLSTDGNYAGSGKGREMEGEAYLLGNGFLVRDWEDSIKYKGVNEMKLTKKELFNIVEELVNEMKKPEEDEMPGGEPGKGNSLDEQESVEVEPSPEVQQILDTLEQGLEALEETDKEIALSLAMAMIALQQDQEGGEKPLASQRPANEEYDPEKADLDKDGKVSDYEEKRGKAAFGESKQNNDTWYNSTLYESLKSKWTK